MLLQSFIIVNNFYVELSLFTVLWFLKSSDYLEVVGVDRPINMGFEYWFGHSLGLERSDELLTNGKWEASNPSRAMPIK